MEGRDSLPLSEAARLACIGDRQLRRDLERHHQFGLVAVRGKVEWRTAPAAARTEPARWLAVQHERWLDLLDMLRDGPVPQDSLCVAWGATAPEVEADLAPLLQNGYIARGLRDQRLTYDLGTAFISSPPWGPADVRLLISVLTQVTGRFADAPSELASARAKLTDWLRGMEATVPVRRLHWRVVKGPRLLPSRMVNDRVDKLEAAARQQRRVRLRYGADVAGRVVEPLGVLYYWVTDAWYLVAHPARPDGDPQLYRIDRISRSRVLRERFIYPSGFSLAEHFLFHWGVEGGPAFAVRVRFYDEAGVLARLRREVAHRMYPTGQAKIISSVGRPYVLYQDVTRGPNDFARWLRTYGSSAVVEEPTGLRRQMAERARQLLEVYAHDLD